MGLWDIGWWVVDGWVGHTMVLGRGLHWFGSVGFGRRVGEQDTYLGVLLYWMDHLQHLYAWPLWCSRFTVVASLPNHDISFTQPHSLAA